jgi:hypothetical protein
MARVIGNAEAPGKVLRIENYGSITKVVKNERDTVEGMRNSEVLNLTLQG